MVLSVDEKSQIQALDRTQPGLPLKPGKAGTMTHDYKRHGTTTLFAALNVLDGTVLGRCMQRHRHQEFIRFLNAIERAVPAGKVIHAILDNYAAHKHPKVLAWLARHPRWTFHFTPTSGSWLNAVETFFSALTRRRLRRGSFHSIVDLQAAINRYIAEHNDDPKPFTWTKPADQILAKLNRLNASVHYTSRQRRPGDPGLVSGRGNRQVFTSVGEWVVTGDPLTPTNVQVEQQSRIGSPRDRQVPPIDVDGATLRRAKRPRDPRVPVHEHRGRLPGH